MRNVPPVPPHRMLKIVVLNEVVRLGRRTACLVPALRLTQSAIVAPRFESEK